MTIKSQRDFLKVQLVEAQRLHRLVEAHPLMAIAFAQKEADIQRQLDELPLGEKEARTVLYFSGGPVCGSVGIDAGFTGKVLEPFQNMVMADYADRWHGVIGRRGRRVGESDSKLILTSLPRGSFGFELIKASSEDLFEEGQLADTLAHVTKLVDSAVQSDEHFSASLDETAPRVIHNLKEFLEPISKARAGLRIETGDMRCTMTPVQAKDAYERVSGTRTEDAEELIEGVFRGALLESWKFDFVTLDGFKISGKMDEELSMEDALTLSSNFLNKSCRALMSKTTIYFKNGRERTTYVLKNLEPII